MGDNYSCEFLALYLGVPLSDMDWVTGYAS
jgi:hypothetical protein